MIGSDLHLSVPPFICGREWDEFTAVGNLVFCLRSLRHRPCHCSTAAIPSSCHLLFPLTVPVSYTSLRPLMKSDIHSADDGALNRVPSPHCLISFLCFSYSVPLLIFLLFPSVSFKAFLHIQGNKWNVQMPMASIVNGSKKLQIYELWAVLIVLMSCEVSYDRRCKG